MKRGRKSKDVQAVVHTQWPGMGTWSAYGDGFFKAAEVLIWWLPRRPDPVHMDELLYPVLFLYRHFVELRLKEFLHLAIALDFSPMKKRDLDRTHSLEILWARVNPVLRNRWPTAPRGPLREAARTIMRLHALDPSGQESRYPLTTKGAKSVAKIAEQFDLAILKGKMTALSNLMFGVISWLNDELEARGGPYPAGAL